MIEVMGSLVKSREVRGTILTLTGGIFWGLAGVFGQYLFENRGLTARWMVSVRMILAGMILFLIVLYKEKKKTFEVLKHKKDFLQLILFGITGMALTQMTYYMSVEASNAGIATVLQYTAPAMIIVYFALRNRKLPNKVEFVALVLAITGTFLLATHGQFNGLAMSRTALVCGLISAVSTVLYNLLPVSLMAKYGTATTVGWGMLLGGIFLCLTVRPWQHIEGVWDWKTYTCLGIVVIVGTVLSFSTYMEGVRLIGATKASLFASVEPLTAMIATVLFMNVFFTKTDFIGLLSIVAAVIILSCPKTQESDNTRERTETYG